MVSVGICATDAHFVWGTAKMESWGHKLPSVLGHEGTGIVESIGSNVHDFQAGDVVLMSIIPQCNECVLCQNVDNVELLFRHSNMRVLFKTCYCFSI